MMSTFRDFEQEVSIGQRFQFGRNWQHFLAVLNEDRIAEAERSLQSMLGSASLQGRSFLDIGSGSGLFSLAAMRLGAARVHSFDYDPQSAACTQMLKRRYYPELSGWTTDVGSVLDESYLKGLGEWDIVYSWGVLHHTGDMWRALDYVIRLVRPGGQLFIAIYNDQGKTSRLWRVVKMLYNYNTLGRSLVTIIFFPYFVLGSLAVDLLHLRNPVHRYRDYKNSRGMSILFDWIDWLGGYPFEVAKPERIFDFYYSRGFELQRLKTCGGKLGCNEFVFRRK